MLTSYLIISAGTAAIALTWRTLLLDHARLLTFVESIPLIGGGLRCGFCSVMWLSLGAVAFYNPLATWTDSRFPILIALCVSWLALASGVLFMRNLIAALMEGTGVLTAIHHQSHEEISLHK
jgi:hypothetical protein